MKAFILLLSEFSQDVVDSTKTTINSEKTSYTWIIISSILFLIVLLVLYKFLKKPKHIINIPKDWKKPGFEPDFDDVFKGISGEAKVLYKELIIKCHPDRFVGDKEMVKKASILSSNITNNKHNHSKLVELKKEAIQELGLLFEE